MTELQERVLLLLQEIDDICQANGIEWYLAAGSALGAIRHQGFIPWDDDADIYMTADNWKKFYALKDQLPEGRALVSVEENFDAGYVINRYADISSTRLYRYLCASPQPAGIIVDILVLDPVPDTPETIKDYVVNLVEYSDVLVKATGHSFRSPYKIDDAKNYEREKQIGHEKLLTEMKAEAEKYDGTKNGVLIQRDPTVPHVWKEDVFGKPVYVPFEHTMMPVASKPYLQLCGAFNEEWMYVPESIERQEHIKGVILDISNNNPFGDYLKMENQEEVSACYTELTHGDNLNGEMRKKKEEISFSMAALRVAMRYQDVEFSAQQMEEWFDKGAFDKIADYYKVYHELQANGAAIGGVSIAGWLRSQDPLYVEVGDDFLYYYLRYLMKTPNLSKAKRILTARAKKGSLPANLQTMCDLIETAKTACCLMEEKKYQETEELLRPWIEKYPENGSLIHIYFGARVYLAREAGKEDLLVTEIRERYPLWRENSVLSCIIADYYYTKGDKVYALNIFRDLAKTSTQGMVLLHICRLTQDAEPGTLMERVHKLAKFKMGHAIELGDEEDEEDEDEDKE